MEQRQRLQELLQKKDWTTEEKQWLLDYLEQANGEELFALQQQDFYDRLTGGQSVEPAVTARMLSAIHTQLDIPTPRTSRVKRLYPLFWRRAIAAAIAGLLVTGGWYWLRPSPTASVVQEDPSHPAPPPDVLPGGNKAVLTLADGSTIVLDDAQNGTLTQQGNMAVQKQEGQLIYNASSKATTMTLPAGATAYNTIRTPRGGQYSILLSDGSKVWLNAASSMRYPIVFNGPQRRVEISGEAYLEVAHNAAQPFIVSVQTAAGTTGEVEVLGTHFNVNAYDDEERMQTTLLEGKVKVVNRQSSIVNRESAIANYQSAILQPGQQATINTLSASSNRSSKIQVQAVDAEPIVAWKNGLFEFDGNTLASVMRQLSRWYDVGVVYEGPLPADNFVGTISRQENLSKVLRMLELTQVVQFKIQEKNAAGEAAKIIVMQKK